jgi:hypothetical protein
MRRFAATARGAKIGDDAGNLADLSLHGAPPVLSIVYYRQKENRRLQVKLFFMRKRRKKENRGRSTPSKSLQGLPLGNRKVSELYAWSIELYIFK